MPKVSQSGKKSPRRTKSSGLLINRGESSRSRPCRKAAVLRGAAAKELEAKLIRRTEVLQQVATGILLTDAEGIVTYFNPAVGLPLGLAMMAIYLFILYVF